MKIKAIGWMSIEIAAIKKQMEPALNVPFPVGASGAAWETAAGGSMGQTFFSEWRNV